MPRLFPKLILLCFLALAACESAEERAARHYQSGLALLETGQVDQALIEFRNVFAADPNHIEARLAYADTQRARGALADAYGHYRHLAEQQPENAPALIALSEIAILSADWEDAETYGRAAAALQPADPAVIAVTAMLDYRAGAIAKDDAARAAAAEIAQKVLQDDPANDIARGVVIDNNIFKGDIAVALTNVEAGLAIDPTRQGLHVIRVRLLGGMKDTAGTQAALEEMAAQFPDIPRVRQELIDWYIAQGDLPAAEDYLRRLAAAPDAGQDQKILLVDFLRQTQGPKAAIAELEHLIADTPGDGTYRMLRASSLFTLDQADAAIAEMKDIIANGTASDETRDFKIVLAQMLQAEGAQAEANTLVADVLAEDAGHVQALKMSAEQLIAADDPDAAISTLRQALAQAPRDIALVTLLGDAHNRAGDLALAGERYALAVDISERAAAPSIHYARFLLERRRIDAAQTVIANALNVAPRNVELLTLMAEIHLDRNAWSSAKRTIWRLRAQNSPLANGIADGLEVDLLKRQGRYEDVTAFLQKMTAGGATSATATAQMVAAQIRTGHLTDARAFVNDQLSEQPGDPTLRFLQAGILVLMEDLPAAEAVYRALLDDFPGNVQVFSNLYALLMSTGREGDADALLDQMLSAAPDASTPNMIKAGRLEAQGDFDGAIAIYERLYAKDSSNTILANNLASLIISERDDADSIARASAIAARLRGSDVPQYQDTLGWISYRRGQYREALSYLEPAARGLPDDSLTHFHLGMTLAALERPAEARKALARAITLGDGSRVAQLDEARDMLATLPE
ncbi:tetratricopeptide repeat protein [Roseovarius sp. M141]|uniref:tetratricopeptide repeat protein n=1 Tax=Roseovarius sp. M141 TaxID=2583806 RepID=UPI0020CD1223|nr:tetratricopeptide repeat protein [Roseovarius sp. M141]MCQ0090472.1 tetratricopeptide repeat protein [Roseovarius sp. M141]